MTARWMAPLYSGLARALAVETRSPDWLCEAGPNWPIWMPAQRLAVEHGWPGMDEAVTALENVPAASRHVRREAFRGLLASVNQSPAFLYESHHLSGRLMGPESVSVGAMYRQVGLEIEGAELPDHAAVELEFLAFLAENETTDAVHSRDWNAARRMFIKQHAGRWLPYVGRVLSTSDDPAWVAIGHLLSAIMRPPRPGRRSQSATIELPDLVNGEACNLCGFCVQICPSQALKIDEDERTTRLVLFPRQCISCNKCVRICEENALQMSTRLRGQTSSVVLCESPRAACPLCGTATVSEAELAAVVSRLDHHPEWLDYCIDCRSYLS